MEQRILVVDDTESNRFLLRAILGSSGYQIDECVDGNQCVEYCSKYTPDLILLDIMMPNMDGIEACRLLREKHDRADLPIIMVTTKTEGENLPQALQVGANDYVTKPIHKEVLLARIRNQIQMVESQRAINRALKIQHSMGDALPQVLLIHDADGNVVYGNRPLLQACGGKMPKTVEEARDGLYAGGAIVFMRDILNRLAVAPKHEILEEVRLVGDRTRELTILSRPIEVEGSPPLRIWLWTDHTERRELERRMNERVRLDTVNMFVTGVAHNFNNILGGIVGAIEVLEKVVPEDDKTKRIMRVIKKGSESAAAFTRKMSLFSRNELGADKNEVEDLGEVFDAVVMLNQQKAGDRIIFELKIDPQLPPIAMSLAHLVEIFNNLISNSIDAIPDKGKVLIAAALVEGRHEVVVTLRDNGVGMADSVLARAFDPFYSTKNLDVKNAVSIQGNGLGLWNVYNLLKLSGGDITMESKVGEGTQVTVHLPILGVGH